MQIELNGEHCELEPDSRVTALLQQLDVQVNCWMVMIWLNWKSWRAPVLAQPRMRRLRWSWVVMRPL